MKRTARQIGTCLAACGAAALWMGAAESRGEAILQVFNQSHNEIAARLPEIAEAGYTALWVPPPTKANGGMSVGYDLNDPFDIGNSDLRGTWSTRYGVEADLHNLIELCHRFGMRVYFDNVMNHRSYDIPGYNESTPTDVYPGMCPEDFHVRTTSDGFYRKWDNVRDWNDEWQVMFLGLSDLLDIAHETPNQNFGPTEGSRHEKPRFVRHPNHPEYYDWNPSGDYVGFGNVTAEMMAEHPDAYAEDVGGYLCRAVRWLVDRTKVDGLRLDAVKHVPWYFFGEADNDGSTAGYVGQVQLQFNRTRGFGDRNNRDTVFDSDAPRNDAMLFGEHLGNPPPQGPYVSAGMRLVDDRLRNELNWRFSANELTGFDGESAGSELGPACGVMHAQSHDNDYVDRKPLHHAMYFMRRGLGLVYSDGNNHAATLTGSGGAFPRWAQTDFLGQWHQKQIPTLLHAHENFARYGQYPKWSQGNFVAFQRGGEGSWATMLFQLNSSWDGWDYAHTSGDFPHDAYLYDYASDMYMPHKDDGSWSDAPYAYGGEIASNIKLPPNSYAIWSWKNPDPSGLYPSPYPDCFVNADDRVIAPDSRVITILEDGQVVPAVMVARKDGVDGDPDFNPYGVADTNAADYSYSIALPRVTKGTNVTLAVKGDGSAGDLLLRLDGGMDFGNHELTGEGWGHYWEQQRWDTEDAVDRDDWRDYPPGSAHDFHLGFEKCFPYFTRRIWSEKFAASAVEKCWIGTQGATTYEITGSATNSYDPENVFSGHSHNAPGWVWHNPAAQTETVRADVGEPVTSTNTYTLAARTAGKDGPAAGFGFWENESNGNAGYFAGGEAAACGLEGFEGGQSFGLFANPVDEGANAILKRSIQHGDGLREISVDVGMLWDSANAGSYKGVEFTDAGGSPIFGVQMENSQAVTYYGANGVAGTWSTDYSAGSNQLPRVFNVKLTRTATGYAVTGTKRGGGGVDGVAVSTGADIAGFKAYMNATDTNAERQLYFDNLTYRAVVTETPTGDREVPQFQPGSGGKATVWAKTSQEQGMRTHLYYTTDGGHWPEGAAGVPANPYTKVVEGSWSANSDSGSWWRFDLPAGTRGEGTTLRYKVSAFKEQGYGGNDWEVVWPGNAGDIANKKAMLSLWTIPGLDFETQGYHKHNDYTSWTTGFKDGYHLVTARLLLNRTDGAPIANTFRQTFYLDRHVPEGYFLYPGEENPDFGESEYGMVFKTDNTVEQVWVHVTDGDPSNDGPGNGVGTNGVEWAQATQISPWTKEMAQDTEFTKIWRYPYTRIPSSGTATIRVRLREVSSAPVGAWSKTDPAEDDLEALHVAEISKVATVHAPAEQFYFDWPSEDGTMVEAGWDVRVKFSTSMISGLPVDSVAGKFRVYVNTISNGSTNRGDEITSGLNIRPGNNNNWWDGDPGTMAFTMPNAYNGIDGWRYALTVAFSNGTYVKSATRMITHRGPLLPTCIITTPPETDSDGAKWIITMEDSTEAAIPTNKALRETPIVVLTDSAATNLLLRFVSPEGYGEQLDVPAWRAAACAAEEAANAAAAAETGAVNTNRVAWPEAGALRLSNYVSNGTTATWTYAWEVTNAGAYRFEALLGVDNTLTNFSSPTNMAGRTATIRFRQTVRVTDPDDADWDDDGITNVRETETNALPSRVDETWTQNEVFTFWSTGKSDADNPDTDGDGLPDGLELGYRWEADGTTAVRDTNGDGWPNFIWDRDPPFYNLCRAFEAGKKGDCGNLGAVPKVTTSNEGGDRAAKVQGSVTDPKNPDTDGDGLSDGVEDANRNGWVDGDGEIIGQDWDPWLGRKWPDGKMNKGEEWEETSPCLWDSDGDGLSDGYGEDVNLNGWTDMGLIYSNAPDTVVPLTPADYADLGIGVDNASTANSSSTLDPKPYTSRMIDYNALFRKFNVTDPAGDGWPRLVILETDPLCADTDGDGLPDGWELQYGLDPLNNGVYDFRTGQWTDDDTHGAGGNPDGDRYPGGPNGEWIPYDNMAEYKGTTDPRSYNDFESGGTGGGEGVEVGVGNSIGTVNDTEYFTEFTWWTLDDLIALDNYNQGGNSSDIYRWGDGFDSSRDLVAFYFRDGGLEDGKLYFRVDLDDLRPFAEESSLNIYVAINRGTYGEDGITALPDDVNCDSGMTWHLVTGVYDSQNGCLYRQTEGQNYESLPGYNGAYFNSELDSVMWSIDRSALIGAGWNGLEETLKFQVYTTRDFTNDDGGSGDKGGLNDFADTIGDDGLCSDYWNDYNWIANHGVYNSCVGRKGADHVWNSCGQHAKLAMVAHGNQAIEAGNTIQALVNDGHGAGYDRPVQIHNIYTNCPLNLHITPTLAMAMQWAETGTTNAWASGPAFNAAIKRGVASGALSLLGSTYSDHILRYFGADFNAANEAAARSVLNALYGDGETDVVSKKVLWSAERVVDATTLRKMRGMGFEATVVDQTPHLLDWFGRQTSLGSDAYKLQRYWLKEAEPAMEAKAFVLSSAADNFRYANTDGGLSEDLRHLFLRRARSGEAAISSIFYRWEDFANPDNANGYDRSLRWIANHPWIQVVTFDEALGDAGLTEKMFYKDMDGAEGMAMQDWVHHACNGNYDKWFHGDEGRGLESLSGKRFQIRDGEALTPEAWGTEDGGIFAAAWRTVQGLTNAQLKALAEATIFASVFETAFHNEANNDLSRWSYGEYMYPATDGAGLMSMAWCAQSRTRLAAVYAEVDAWAGKATGLKAYAKDVDLDGEDEWVLQNDKVMAVFEAEGGVMVGAWLKSGTNVWQMVGNFAAQPETGYETQSTGEDSRRGTALKDTWVNGAARAATMFTATAGEGSLTFADGGLAKTVRLADKDTGAFEVEYAGLDGSRTNYVRNGLSPDLATLMIAGQSRMSETAEGTNAVTVATSTGGGKTVSAKVAVAKGGINTGARDQPENSAWNTVNLRNAAQVRQVEVEGRGEIRYTLEFKAEDTAHADPVITVTPKKGMGGQTFPVGVTSSFRVTAADWNGNELAVEAVAMPEAVYMSGAPAWNSETGVFSWHVGALGAAGTRTNAWSCNATFRARDAEGGVAEETVDIVIPWDADGNGIADDWEWLLFRNDEGYTGKKGADFDEDGFSDRDEWVAGTNPKDDWDYIGWERQVLGADGLELTFRSVAGATYQIEAVDARGLVLGAWSNIAMGVESQGETTTWTDSGYAGYTNRLYRLRVPFFAR